MADLQRFLDAQSDVYDRALAEIRSGRKTSHWMWFVFPQLAGLGSSPTARYFAIASLAEAREYLGHPVLGPRVRESAAAATEASTPARSIFGSVDTLKLRSSMTLFDRADDADADARVFAQVLLRHFDGVPDPLTVRLLETAPSP